MILKRFVHKFAVSLILCGMAVSYTTVYGQNPVISVRFANPQNDCVTQEYCLDVEFRADMPDLEVFGMNIRFFYDDDILELIDFRDFQGGYGPVAPNPPISSTSIPAGPALFNFEGAAEFINGAMQLVSTGPPPIILETVTWTKLFQMCFTVDGPYGSLDTFCPPVVWDLEQDPENGGFLAGDDGVVITITDPDPNNESLPANELADQFNWQYTGNGTPPYGEPIDLVCSNINCALPATLLSFSGKAGESGNLLEWTTTNEFNLDGFNVQYSTNGITWINLEYVKSGLSGQEVHVYTYLHAAPPREITYYRLQMVDKDGRASLSRLISIHSKGASSNQPIIVFPNPASQDKLYISIPPPVAEGTVVRLFDPMGHMLKEGVADETGMAFDISLLPAGLYMVWVVAEDRNHVARVVIE